MSFTEEIKRAFSSGTVLTRLIILNIALFAAVKILALLFFLFNLSPENMAALIRWLAVPAGLKVLLFRPWTPLTYMFLHEGVLHILFNMLWLYWFGMIFLEYLGSKKLLSTYLLGGLCGAALYIVSFNIFPVFLDIADHSFALGASAAVLAVVIAISVYVPDYTIFLLFFGPVRIKYIAIFSVVLDVLSIPGDNAGGHIAHLGGALFGYFYSRKLKQGTDLAKGFSRFMDQVAASFSSFPKRKTQRENGASRSPYKSDNEYNARKAAKQKKLDEILDKISKSGYDSLSTEEKNLLFDISKEQ